MGNKPKWTPGPWERISDNHFRVEQDDTGYTSWIALGPVGGLTVALAVTDGDCDDDETDANAALIKAAPDLYKALDILARASDQWSGQIEPPPAALDRAWQVLAQARGETNVDR